MRLLQTKIAALGDAGSASSLTVPGGEHCMHDDDGGGDLSTVSSRPDIVGRGRQQSENSERKSRTAAKKSALVVLNQVLELEYAGWVQQVAQLEASIHAVRTQRSRQLRSAAGGSDTGGGGKDGTCTAGLTPSPGTTIVDQPCAGDAIGGLVCQPKVCDQSLCCRIHPRTTLLFSFVIKPVETPVLRAQVPANAPANISPRGAALQRAGLRTRSSTALSRMVAPDESAEAVLPSELRSRRPRAAFR